VVAVNFLTEQGAEPDLPLSTQSTALHVAFFYGHAGVVCCLLESGANYRKLNGGKKTAEEEAYDDEVKRVFIELKQMPYIRAAGNEID
jgi:ankyrin repeat protein